MSSTTGSPQGRLLTMNGRLMRQLEVADTEMRSGDMPPNMFINSICIILTEHLSEFLSCPQASQAISNLDFWQARVNGRLSSLTKSLSDGMSCTNSQLELPFQSMS